MLIVIIKVQCLKGQHNFKSYRKVGRCMQIRKKTKLNHLGC